MNILDILISGVVCSDLFTGWLTDDLLSLLAIKLIFFRIELLIFCALVVSRLWYTIVCWFVTVAEMENFLIIYSSRVPIYTLGFPRVSLLS